MSSPVITVQTTVNAPITKVWDCWTKPGHITQWSFASDDWYSPHAENDLRVDGKFNTGMAAKDGSFKFDFEGVYTDIKHYSVIEYVLGDGRKTRITFKEIGDTTEIVESFNAENQNSVEVQRAGWQAILDNFKKYTEAN